MNKVRVGIVGYGNMGSLHAENLMSGKVPEMELTAVADIAEARRTAVQEKYPGLSVFENESDLFHSGLVDAVILSVPHYFHPPYAIEAFDSGLHVMTEKPAGVYTKQVKEMNERAARSDRVFGIMFNMRTKPSFQKLREMVRSGELGHIKRITWIVTHWYRSQAYHDSSTWRSTWGGEGGGTLMNQNPHQLDIWQWIFGMPDRIYARVSFGKYHDIEVDDDVVALFEYNNGTLGEYIASTGEYPGSNRLEISCDMGKIVIENNRISFDRNLVSEREFEKTNTIPFGLPGCEKVEMDIDDSTAENHVGILKNFASCILHGTPLLAPGEEGIKMVTMADAMYLSAWTGETVDLHDFPDDRYYEMLQDRIAHSTVVKKDQQIIQQCF